MLYLRVTYFQILRYFTYPMEIVGTILKRGIEVGFVVLFWWAVSHSSQGLINTREIISYILISSSVAGIASSSNLYFGAKIHEVVKMGTINNYLIKPVSLIPYLYATFFGERSTTVAVAIVTLLGGILLSPVHLTLLIWTLFLAYFVLAFAIMTALSVIVGVFAFYMTEASSARYTIAHALRILSGAIVPISFFPEPWRNLVLHSPFPVTLYGPASVFAPSTAVLPHSQLLTTGALWAIALWVVAAVAWNRSLKHYDAIGI